MTIGITVTGADIRTDVADLLALAQTPGVETGLLFSLSPEGRNRYPDEGWLAEAATELGLSCAVHICGWKARQAALNGECDWIQRAGRVQINGRIDLDQLERATELFRCVITQYPGAGDVLAHPARNHSILVDASGGTGVEPNQWKRPDTDKPVGFAGGLSPQNFDEHLPGIASVAIGRWWIDMESCLRYGWTVHKSDWFDMHQVWLAVERFTAWKAREGL